MTEKSYTRAPTLADHFEYWRGRLGSDRAASDQVRRLYALAPGSKLVRLPGGAVMLETSDGLVDAALFATEPEPPVPLKADLSLFTPELEESLYGEKGRGAVKRGSDLVPTIEQKSEAPVAPAFTHKKGIAFYNGLVGKGLNRDTADRAARAHFGPAPMLKLLVAARKASKFNRERGRPSTKPR